MIQPTIRFRAERIPKGTDNPMASTMARTANSNVRGIRCFNSVITGALNHSESPKSPLRTPRSNRHTGRRWDGWYAQLVPQIVHLPLGVRAFTIAQDGLGWVPRNQAHKVKTMIVKRRASEQRDQLVSERIGSWSVISWQIRHRSVIRSK